MSIRNNLVFLAGPVMGGGDVEQQIHIRNALLDADRIREAGFLPYVPHLCIFWDLVSPHERDYWLRMAKDWLLHAGALVRRPGLSVGADVEVEWAKSIGLPIYDLEAFLAAPPDVEQGLDFEPFAGDVSRATED